MFEKHKNISKLALLLCILGGFNTNSSMAIEDLTTNEIELRGAVDETPKSIQLKTGISFDNKDQKISISLRDSDVRQVLRMLADRAGLNIILHESVKGTVTLDLKNVSLSKAFEHVMALNTLSYTKDNKTLIVVDNEQAGILDLTKSQITPIKVKYIETETAANFLNNNIFSMNNPGISSAPTVTINTRKNELLIFGNKNDVELARQVIDVIDVKPEITTFDVNFAHPDEIAKKICLSVFVDDGEDDDDNNSSNSNSNNSSSNNNNSSSSSSDNSNTTGSTIMCGSQYLEDEEENGSSRNNRSSNSSVSSDNATSNSSLEATLDSPYWVMSDSDLNKVLIYGATKEQLEIANEIIKDFDKKQPQVYVDISIIELSESGSKALSSTISANYSKGNIEFNGTRTNYEIADKALTAIPGVSDILTNTTDYNNGIKSVVAAINALVKESKGRVLANPRIIATHNRTSEISISSDYVASRTQEVIQTNGEPYTSTSYEIDSKGINIMLRPRVSANGFINLELTPSYTSEKEPVLANDELVATLLNRRDIKLSDLRIKDGETLVIGGLIQETEQTAKNKVPVLGDIPILGNLFKGSTNSKERAELILMITPRIIHDQTDVKPI